MRNNRPTLEGNILPRLGTLWLEAIGSRDVESLKTSPKAAPYRANRALALLSHTFSKAIESKWAKENLARGAARYQEEKCEPWPSGEEIASFTKVLDANGNRAAANALRLLLLTGVRQGEVLSAESEQFVLKRGVWTKPSHHTKQKGIEHVPLRAAAPKLVRAMKAKDSTGRVSPSRKGGAQRMSFRKSWVATRKRAGRAEPSTVERATPRGRRSIPIKWRPTLRAHDLWHTLASHLVSRGTSLQIVGKLLGHTQVATTARRAYLADSAPRDATNLFGKTYGNSLKPTKGRKASEPHQEKSVAHAAAPIVLFAAAG